MPETNTHDIGDIVQVKAIFRNQAGDLTDPTTIRLKIRRPDKTTSTYTYLTDPEVQRESLGVFISNLDIDQAGVWVYRWEGEGPVKAAEEHAFDIRRSKFY